MLDSEETNIKYAKTEWIFRSESNTPQQTNNYDCGIFLCLFSKLIIYAKKITTIQFTIADIIKFRSRMKKELSDSLQNDYEFNFLGPVT
jgi:Ulp1 family protease